MARDYLLTRFASPLEGIVAISAVGVEDLMRSLRYTALEAMNFNGRTPHKLSGEGSVLLARARPVFRVFHSGDTAYRLFAAITSSPPGLNRLTWYRTPSGKWQINA